MPFAKVLSVDAHADTAIAPKAAAASSEDAAAAVHALASLMQDWNGAAVHRKSKQALLKHVTHLVDQDPRVPPEHPPVWAHVTDLAGYHRHRAQVLKDVLVETAIAYFCATQERMYGLPIPPPHTTDDL